MCKRLQASCPTKQPLDWPHVWCSKGFVLRPLTFILDTSKQGSHQSWPTLSACWYYQVVFLHCQWKRQLSLINWLSVFRCQLYIAKFFKGPDDVTWTYTTIGKKLQYGKSTSFDFLKMLWMLHVIWALFWRGLGCQTDFCVLVLIASV